MEHSVDIRCFYSILSEDLRAESDITKKDKKNTVWQEKVVGLVNSSETLPSAATECYSPWHSPDSAASSLARKASPFGPCSAWFGLYRAQPQVGSPSAGYLWPGSPLRDGSVPPQGGWKCSCRGRAVHGAAGALRQSRWPAHRPGRWRTRPAGDPCQGQER